MEAIATETARTSIRIGEEHHEPKTEKSASAAKRALIGIFNFTLQKLQEFSRDDIIEDKQGFKAVFNITTIIGNMVMEDQVSTDIKEPFAALLADTHEHGKRNGHTNGTSNGNGHAPAPRAKRSEPKSKVEPAPSKPPLILDQLTPRETELVTYLRDNYKNGSYVTEKSISKALGLNHVSPLVQCCRKKGIPIASASADRKKGVNVPDTASGYQLVLN